VEQTGSEADKLSWLNNLETIYDETITYLATFTHLSLYYTKAECDAKYFSSSTDGSGTGLVCEKLDGYTSAEIINMGTPPGSVAIWSGDEASIPTGWELYTQMCDRFVVSAGGNYSYGETGGSNVVTTYATVAIADHALTAAEIPLHTHGTITDHYSNAEYLNILNSGSGSTNLGASEAISHTNYTSTGTSTGHNHTASFVGTSNQDKRPPYYALCYIIKL
jgi:hypothetical protein